MKYAKALSLAVVAAVALMAFIGASTASATALYSGETKLGVGSEIDASLPSGKSIVLVDPGGEELDRCSSSTLKGTLENAGGSTATVKKKANTTTWGSCSFPTTTTTLGGLEFHWIPGTWNATVTWTGFSITVNTIFFGSCVYGVESTPTHLGTFEGKKVAWEIAKLLISIWLKKKLGSNLGCPSEAKLIGEYSVTSPTGLYAAES